MKAITLQSMLFVAAATSIASAQTASIEFIPDALSANDMTPDGRYIVGETDFNGDFLPDGTYRYDTQTGEMLILPAEALGVSAVSDNGTLITGEILNPEGGGDQETVAALLNLNSLSGWQSLGYLPNAGACPSRSNAYEISGDGNTIVGLSWDGCAGRGFIWDAVNGMQELEPLANGGNRASVVSADGTVIAGFGQGNTRTPTMWSSDTTGSMMGVITDNGEIRGISDDGTILLGEYYTDGYPDNSFRAVTWTDADGFQIIGEGSLLPGWAGTAQDISDGGVIVGFDRLFGNRRAWIKTPEMKTMEVLQLYIESLGAEVPDEVELEVCQAISTDGTRIIGHGTFSGAWIVNITPACQADLSGDGTVDTIDLLDLLNAWGACKGCDQDLNSDGIVDTIDLLDLLGAWGDCE